MEQMLELMKSMQEEMKSNQAMMDTHREVNQEHMQQMMTKIVTNREEMIGQDGRQPGKDECKA
jgi:hypothetical protein